MKKLKPRIVHSLILIFFTVSSLVTFLTESFHSNQIGYSPILISLPSKYYKIFEGNTKIYFYEACYLNETCSILYLLVQCSVLVSFLIFYISSLLLKSFTIYYGLGYIVLNSVYIVLCFVYSDKFIPGISIHMLNIILSAVLIYFTKKRLSFDKNIVKYDVVQNPMNNVPGSMPSMSRGYSGQLNDSQLNLNNLPKKIDRIKGKYRNIKMIYKESRTDIVNLKEELEITNKKYLRLEEKYKNLRDGGGKSLKIPDSNPEIQDSGNN